MALPFKALRPLLNRVLIKVSEPITKTKGGIMLAQSKAQKQNFGKVLKVGPGRTNADGKLVPVALKEGDWVLIPEYGGTKVQLQEEELVLYREDDIIGLLDGKVDN